VQYHGNSPILGLLHPRLQHGLDFHGALGRYVKLLEPRGEESESPMLQIHTLTFQSLFINSFFFPFFFFFFFFFSFFFLDFVSGMQKKVKSEI
jgi:hypothetical protein